MEGEIYMSKDYNSETLSQMIEKTLEQYGESSVRFNVLISGKVGVGKSTLVNSIFRQDIADTGIGRPVLIGPKGYRSYEKEDLPVKLFDTEGIELDAAQQNKLLVNLDELLNNKESTVLEDRIHMIWYCINAQSRRLEEGEEDFINKLSLACEPSVPVIIILTQSIFAKQAKEFQKELEEIFKNNDRIKYIVPVLAQTIDEDEIHIESYGLTELCEHTAKEVPDAVKNSFLNSQKVSIELKEKRAKEIINRYTVIASGIGGGSGVIGVDDSIALLSIQCAMFVEVSYLFGLKLEKSRLMTIGATVIGSVVASAVGKTTFSFVIRATPIVGQLVPVIEGIVRAGIAGVVTQNIGKAFLGVMQKLAQGEINVDDIEDAIVDILKKPTSE